MVTWLNVAEKASVAREVVNVLSGGCYRSIRSFADYNPVFKFNYEGKEMLFTSVAGHLMELDFPSHARKWESFPLLELFTVDTVKYVKSESEGIEKNLMEYGKNASMLALWMDCDREGENICFEVIAVVQKVHRAISVCRAHFSALTKRDILRAMGNLQAPNRALSEAVEARQELDLRVGAAFTRFQSLKFRLQFDGWPSTVSFGPCQFPTLGFLVRRSWEQKGFVQETYFTLFLQHDATSFSSVRGAIYDQIAATVVLEQMFEEAREKPEAEIVNVVKRPNRRRPPAPLATVTLQKLCATHLRMPSEQCMSLAERLYQEGYISYPRTETDCFSFTDAELLDIAALQRSNPEVSAFVESMLADPSRKFRRPLDGGHNDKAHPPIYPTKPMLAGNDSTAKLYNLIVRHFLACISPDAVASTTSVTAVYGGEQFTASGTTIDERGWMEVWSYNRWNSTTLPTYKLGERFSPTCADLRQHRTEPPPNLSEADLISLMDKHGIGTDATISQHIKMVVDRGYVKREGSLLVPTTVGNALASAYEANGLISLLQPQMRAKMEFEMAKIAAGKASKQDVVAATVVLYREIFQRLFSKVKDMRDVICSLISPVLNPTGEVEQRACTQVRKKGLVACGFCKKMMDLVELSQGWGSNWAMHCATCGKQYPVPSGRHNLLERNGGLCAVCGFGALNVSNIEKKTNYNICPYCFTSPPPGATVLTEFRCFHCTADCPLSKKSTGPAVATCISCWDHNIHLQLGAAGYFVGCRGYPHCKFLVSLHAAERVNIVPNARCPSCDSLLLNIEFGGNQDIPRIEDGENVCLLCDIRLFDRIRVKNFDPKIASRFPQQDPRLQCPLLIHALSSVSVAGGMHPRSAAEAGDEPPLLCSCGKEVSYCVSQQVNSLGRRFATCTRKKCSFFQWLE